MDEEQEQEGEDEDEEEEQEQEDEDEDEDEEQEQVAHHLQPAVVLLPPPLPAALGPAGLVQFVEVRVVDALG